MEKSMQNLIETLYGVKSGYGHYKVSIDVDGQELSTVTDNMSAIDAAFDEYYDDEDNEGRFYESREEAQEALVNEILNSNKDDVEQIYIKNNMEDAEDKHWGDVATWNERNSYDD